MRDKYRIDAILNELQKIWMEFSDLRLGQLLLNVVEDPKLYYIEDEVLIEKLKEFYISCHQKEDLRKKTL